MVVVRERNGNFFMAPTVYQRIQLRVILPSQTRDIIKLICQELIHGSYKSLLPTYLLF